MVINLSATVGVGQPAANVKPNRRQSYLYKKQGLFLFCLLNNFFLLRLTFFSTDFDVLFKSEFFFC
jgi:hypothetical protein